MELLTNTLELRGLKNAKSKNGNIYYTLNCENMETGEPYQCYCPSGDVLPQGLKKGDKIKITFHYNKFKSLVVQKVQKVG